MKRDDLLFWVVSLTASLLAILTLHECHQRELRREPTKLWQRSDIPRTEFTANHRVRVHQTTRGYVEVRP